MALNLVQQAAAGRGADSSAPVVSKWESLRRHHEVSPEHLRAAKPGDKFALLDGQDLTHNYWRKVIVVRAVGQFLLQNEFGAMLNEPERVGGQDHGVMGIWLDDGDITVLSDFAMGYYKSPPPLEGAGGSCAASATRSLERD